MSNFLIDEETDLLAAEFVLGSLDFEERAQAHGLLRTDHTFIAMVRIWERRFGELHLMVEPVDPDAAILRRIKAKVFALTAAETTTPEPKAIAEAAPPPATPSPPPSQPVAASAPQLPKAANIDLKPLQAVAEAAAASLQAIAAGEVLPTSAVPPPLAASPAAQSADPEAVAAVPESAAPEAASPATVPTATAPQEGAAPAMFPPVAAASGLETSSAAEVRPALEVRPPEPVIKIDREPVAKVNVPQAPLSAPRLPERFPERIQGRSAERGPEITIDVIRSRGRWRVLGILMSLFVLGLIGLLATWRLAPDRLPARLQPAQFMTALGIGVGAPTDAPRAQAPVAKPPAPAGQFDE